MALFTFEDFRSNIIRCTTNRSLPFSIELKFGSEAKVADFDFHLIVQEEIAQFEVSVDNSMRMQVFDGITKLCHVALYFQFMESLAPTEELVERLTLAQLKNYINVFSIFKEMLKPYNIRMVE